MKTFLITALWYAWFLFLLPHQALQQAYGVRKAHGVVHSHNEVYNFPQLRPAQVDLVPEDGYDRVQSGESYDPDGTDTGGYAYGDKYDLIAASAPAKLNEYYPIQGRSAADAVYKKDQPYVPSDDDVHGWKLKNQIKQRTFMEKYKNKVSQKDGLYSDGDFSNAEGFHAESHFSSIADHNITKEDIGSLDYALLSGKGSVDYNTLRRTPHGRHLLLISLLEDHRKQYWAPRCSGRLSMFLPRSLKSSKQPRLIKGAILLKDIRVKGKLITRKHLLKRVKQLPFGKFNQYEHISRFNSTHVSAVSSMIKYALRQETFDCMLSLLVALEEIVNPRIFTEVVLAVIDSRDDVGFVKPSFMSVKPYDYFPIQSYKKQVLDKGNPTFDSRTNHIVRTRRQALSGQQFGMREMGGRGGMMRPGAWGQQGPGGMGLGGGVRPPMPGGMWPGGPNGMRQPGQGGIRQPGQGGIRQPGPGVMRPPAFWRINWGDGQFRTLSNADPESQLWYFREDPMVNAHHYHWHLKLSNRDVPSWHPSHGLNMDRRGEMFCFMHKQMLARYNADRLGLGMPLTTAFNSAEWTRPITGGYNSRLTEATGRAVPARPNGAVIFDSQSMFAADNALRQAIRQGTLQTPNGVIRLGYENGVDIGISHLGDAVEAFQENTITFNLHNDGHEAMGRLHGLDDSVGAMGNPNIAMRDPLFYRWHKYMADLIFEYKRRLPPYTDLELAFPGVEITAAHITSERGQGSNNLYTYMDSTSIRLASIDFEELEPGRSVNIMYDRLNHVPFTYHLNVRSQYRVHGLLRIFLIPANIRLPAHTDVTQVAIEMDRFLISMNPGDNYFTRHSARSPFITKASLPLGELQDRLLQGQISEEEFNWSGCGWPEHMVLPRGREGGMRFRVYMMISQVLPGDSAMTANWERMQFTSWSWCGVRRNEGDVPDSRPMGFPLDRPPPNGNWQSLMYSGGQRRGNHFTFDATIFHDRIGTTRSNAG